MNEDYEVTKFKQKVNVFYMFVKKINPIFICYRTSIWLEEIRPELIGKF